MAFLFEDTQILQQLEAQRGGYCYSVIPAVEVMTWTKAKKTRLICKLADTLDFQCGLNPLGNGDFFIIISQKNVTKAGLVLGRAFTFSVREDPNPLGVALPESLQVLLDQDHRLSKKYESLTDGKKRAIIHQINRIKNMDLQIQRAQELLVRQG